MDATGNECGMATQTTAQVDPSLWTVIAARLAPRAAHIGAVDSAPLAGAVSKVSAPLASDSTDSVISENVEHPIR
ncbi:MAG: hypothetical protein ROZ64_14615 [Burkholderiaceae bacterium]|nr:hypothetical protein [Burkholderiaceae bacterium]